MPVRSETSGANQRVALPTVVSTPTVAPAGVAAAARNRNAGELQISPALRQAAERLPAPLVAQALARLARSPFAVTPVTMSLAALSLRQDLPRIAAWLPAGVSAATTASPAATAASVTIQPTVVGRSAALTVETAPPAPTKPLESTIERAPVAPPELPQTTVSGAPRNATQVVPLIALPGRSAVDLAVGDPRQAAAQALRLAGIVPSTATLSGAEAHEPVAALVHRLVLLARSALAMPEATRAPTTAPAADAPPVSTGAGGASQRESAPGGAALPPLPAHQTVADRGERAAASDPALPTPLSANDAAPATLALRDAVAQDLLPPRELTDYDRVIALPLAIAGDPVPARLAVSVRRSASGGTTCWMRVDCELSRLGPVSVRLGGTDGGPVVITLIAGPATGAKLAQALPALAADLREQGVDAALRVATEASDEVSS